MNHRRTCMLLFLSVPVFIHPAEGNREGAAADVPVAMFGTAFKLIKALRRWR